MTKQKVKLHLHFLFVRQEKRKTTNKQLDILILPLLYRPNHLGSTISTINLYFIDQIIID